MYRIFTKICKSLAGTLMHTCPLHSGCICKVRQLVILWVLTYKQLLWNGLIVKNQQLHESTSIPDLILYYMPIFGCELCFHLTTWSVMKALTTQKFVTKWHTDTSHHHLYNPQWHSHTSALPVYVCVCIKVPLARPLGTNVFLCLYWRWHCRDDAT